MPVSLFSSSIHSPLFADDDLARLFDDASDVAHMIQVERALAIAEGSLEIIPADAAHAIAETLQNLRIEPADLAEGTRSAGVLVPALVSELRKQVGGAAANWLHWGATSQDIIDTAMILQVKAALGLQSARLEKLIDTLERQSERFATRLMAGRTRSQVSTPITLGYRIAQWAHPLIDAEAALPELRRTALRVQFGGASGINTAIAPNGPVVAEALARELDLAAGPSWHVNRTPVLAVAAWLQQVSAGLAKMAGDLVLLGRSEIAELSSGTGGGSSTMPQKANPVQSETILALNRIVIAAQAGLASAGSPLEERDGSVWPLEWHFLPQMMIAVGTALTHAQRLAETLVANETGLDGTLDAHPELMAETASFVLARHGVPRAEAKKLVGDAATGSSPFLESLKSASNLDVDWDQELSLRSAIAPASEMSKEIFARRLRR